MAKKKQDNPANAGKLQGRDEKGRFIEGVSGNPDGKLKGTISYSKRLDEALNEIEKTGNKSLFKRFINRAFINDKVLVAAMKKFVPDVYRSEISGTEGEPIIINLVPVNTPQDIENLKGNND